MLHAGHFRHRITFQKFDPNVRDKNGFPLPEEERYTDWHTTWAMIKTLKGRERYAAASIQAENELRFVVRWNRKLTSLTNKDRIKLKKDGKERYFDIKSVLNDDELNRTLTIVATERM